MCLRFLRLEKVVCKMLMWSTQKRLEQPSDSSNRLQALGPTCHPESVRSDCTADSHTTCFRQSRSRQQLNRNNRTTDVDCRRNRLNRETKFWSISTNRLPSFDDWVRQVARVGQTLAPTCQPRRQCIFTPPARQGKLACRLCNNSGIGSQWLKLWQTIVDIDRKLLTDWYILKKGIWRPHEPKKWKIFHEHQQVQQQTELEHDATQQH